MSNERHAAHEAFVMEYLRNSAHGSASVVDAEFHDAFHERFGGVRHWKAWGAQPVPAAMSAIRRLYVRRFLKRSRSTLKGNWQPGFPRWVWEYELAARRA